MTGMVLADIAPAHHSGGSSGHVVLTVVAFVLVAAVLALVLTASAYAIPHHPHEPKTEAHP